MMRRILFLFAYFFASASALNTPESFIKLTLGVSKATYFRLDSGGFLQNGQIMENPTLASLKSYKDIEKYDQPACSTGGWTAKSYVNQEVEVLMFTNAAQKLVIFGFRGTELTNKEDWGKTLDTAIVNETIGADSFWIHKGYLARYNFISAWFEQEYSQIPNDFTILLTGHSLGGAEATIAAVYAASKLGRKPDAVITYGSPKIGTSEFMNYYQQVVGCDRTMRVSVSGDPAPYFPLLPWYHHVCDPNKVSGKFTFNLLYKHKLYGGYEDGIEKKYTNVNSINIGCDQ